VKQAAILHHNPSINTIRQRLNLLQFFSIAVLGMTTPFINLYLIEVGFSATLVGTLLSMGAFLQLALTPLLNTVADRQNRHRQLFLLYILIFGLANLLFANTVGVITLGIAMLLVEVSAMPSLTLGMQLMMTRLTQIGHTAVGRMRAYAALGFSLASLSAGPLFNIGGYQLLFWVGAMLCGLSAQLSSVLPTHIASKEEQAQTAPKRKRGFYILAVSQFFTMMGIRSGHAFWLVHFSQNLGLPTGQIGLVMALVAGAEVPFFVMLDPILKRSNPRVIYIIGSMGIGLFFLSLGFATSIWWVIPMILVRGLLWPMYHLPIYLVAAQISHPRNVATNQALIQITVSSLAVLLTGSAAGWIFDNLGALPFFAACAAACAIGAVIALVGYRSLRPLEQPVLQSAAA